MSGRPEILFIAPGGVNERGGMGRLARFVEREWRSAGRSPGLRVIDPYGPNVAALSPLFLLWACASIVGRRLCGRVALLHVNMAKGGSLVRKALILLVGRALAIPIVLHVHMADALLALLHRSPSPVRRLWAAVFSSADLVVVLGQKWVTPLAAALNIPEERLRVLRNGVPDPGPPPARNQDIRRIAFLGRLDASKGLPELLSALVRLKALESRWQATIAGRGDVAAVRDRILDAGLASHVEVAGWLDEEAARALLAQSEVLVLPSREEGLSIAMLEGLASGLALVVTPAGAAAEVVEHGRDALMVPYGDVTALAHALAALVSDGELTRALGEASRQRFEDGLGIVAHAEALQAIYDGVMSARPREG